MSDFCQLWLSCKDAKEASKIADVLLSNKLVACSKQILVKSSFHWQGKIEGSDEILLMMESRADLFDQIEEAVTKLHSYDTFVLEAVPVSKVSTKAEKWLTQELKNA